jgi:hypothetical protein
MRRPGDVKESGQRVVRFPSFHRLSGEQSRHDPVYPTVNRRDAVTSVDAHLLTTVAIAPDGKRVEDIKTLAAYCGCHNRGEVVNMKTAQEAR